MHTGKGSGGRATIAALRNYFEDEMRKTYDSGLSVAENRALSRHEKRSPKFRKGQVVMWKDGLTSPTVITKIYRRPYGFAYAVSTRNLAEIYHEANLRRLNKREIGAR